MCGAVNCLQTHHTEAAGFRSGEAAAPLSFTGGLDVTAAEDRYHLVCTNTGDETGEGPRN